MEIRKKEIITIIVSIISMVLIGLYIISCINMDVIEYREYENAPLCKTTPPTSEGLCKVSNHSWYQCKNTTTVFEPYFQHFLGCEYIDEYDVRT